MMDGPVFLEELVRHDANFYLCNNTTELINNFLMVVTVSSRHVMQVNEADTWNTDSTLGDLND